MIRAFTGPSQLTPLQRRWAILSMLEQPSADVWRSGAAHGLDTVAARLAITLETDLELYVPAANHNETLVRQLAPQATQVIRCPHRATTSDSYRSRNEIMVTGAVGPRLIEPSDQLQAFVLKPNFYRSGEWMTINIALKRGIEVIKVILP